ncbi:MAG: hypothetical protein JWP52_3952 [Rhizobacter sp.]|nr:hypothetical protein [Rhizobacter sp.]
MKLSRLSIGIAVAVLFAASIPAQAASVLYDFENQPIFTETPFTMTAGGVSATFAGPSDVDPGAFGISSNFQSPTGFQYRLMNGDFLTIGSAFGASGSPLTITFSAAVTSFSLDFALDDPDNTTALSFTTSANGTATGSGSLTAGFRYPEGSLAFSGTPFTSITFQSNAIDFQLDNLQVTTIAAVPEPESLLLIAAGLPLLAFARRRARRGATA